MASDIAIAQFRFLERLLLVHGHWFYKRISTMVSVFSFFFFLLPLLFREQTHPILFCILTVVQICYFFYKNMLFGFTLFFYEAYTSFSGEPAYNEWYLTLYNIMFTSFPVIALGVLDQDVSAQSCLKVITYLKLFPFYIFFPSHSI